MKDKITSVGYVISPEIPQQSQSFQDKTSLPKAKPITPA
jgi:hypothetical protein